MSLIDDVATAVERWEPKSRPHEQAYRDDLAAYLDEKLTKTAIRREYRDYNTTTDIFVSRGSSKAQQVYVELKRNLSRKPQVDRLLGQVMPLLRDKRRVVVVLLGKTRRENAADVREKLGLNVDVWGKSILYVLEKPC